ncbi:marine proteobacterial sortase target protein, partial [Gammaproteobacteria bacterium]|nr:marine proteobacterial sortase target protein [Gammaproteobacteria bacterium]
MKIKNNLNNAYSSIWIIILYGFVALLSVEVNAQNPEETQSGALFLRSANGNTQTAVHLQTQINMRVEGMINRVSLRQSFSNNSNEWQEGVYVFPLPEDSAVNHMQMLLDERVIVGEIHEKAEAQKIYQQARSEGRKAALVEQQRANMFTQSVANIGPGETITIELQYVQAVRYDSGQFSFRFPMTLTPRYIPGVPLRQLLQTQEFISAGSGWATPTNQVPDADKITPPYLASNQYNVATLSIDLDAGLPLSNISSPSHALNITELTGPTQQNKYQLSFSSGQENMEKDFELQWQPQAGAEPQAASFIEHAGENSFVQLMLLPPQIENEDHSLNRELILILDTSGSMGGSSIVQAKLSVELALAGLRSDDRFNVIEFNSSHRALFPAAVPATQQNRQTALNFVRNLQANGGTNMAPALLQAFTTNENDEQPTQLKQVVFITDGSVGNESELFTLINNRLDKARLFTVGIGSAPNSLFMRKAAQFGRGTYTYISSTEQVSTQMNTLFRKLENPAMADIQITWPAGMQVE